MHGASMVLGANSRAKVEGKRIVLEQGLAALHKGSDFRFEARTLRIAPATANAAAQVQLDGGNRVLVAAVNGPVRVFSESGLLVASVVPGSNLSFEPKAEAAADGFDRTGCLLFKDGHFALVDSNGQVSEVQSKDFVRSLVEGTGNTVHIVGTIVKVDPVEGTARVGRSPGSPSGRIPEGAMRLWRAYRGGKQASRRNGGIFSIELPRIRRRRLPRGRLRAPWRESRSGPFRDVYFTGIIRDAQGRKMSKSLGNSPDPIDLIDIYGADGLRFGIVSTAPQGQDIRFQEERIEGGKNFCNKLWNACRFRQMSGPAGDNSSPRAILARINPAKFDADDHAVLDRLLATTREVDRCFAAFEFSAATQALYGFFWNDFCDWYVEVSKSKLQSEDTRDNCLAIQDLVLRQTLLLLHPVIPFITEELWSLLGYSGSGGALIQDGVLENASHCATALGVLGAMPQRAEAATVERMKLFVSRARALKGGPQPCQPPRREIFPDRRRRGVVDRPREPRQAHPNGRGGGDHPPGVG